MKCSLVVLLLVFNDLLLIGFVYKIGFNESALIVGGANPNKRIVFKINIKLFVIFFHVQSTFNVNMVTSNA